MVSKVNTHQFLELSKNIPILDVRSPLEYAQGHIPGAISFPLFDNPERALIGTLYKNSGREAAILRGFEIVGPKLATFLKKATSLASHKQLNVHCWRGGMRSGHMAWLFSQGGLTVNLLEGGYKAYRRYIREQFSCQGKLVILGGMTGSGKSEILRDLEERGEQFLDLERLANHKGSAFGALGQEMQPTNEQFENDIASKWLQFDFSRPVWIEDESRSIGTVSIPDPLFHRMFSAPIVMVHLDRSIRIKRLVEEYGSFDESLLAQSLHKISEKLGGGREKIALSYLSAKDLTKVAEITLDYYDKAYTHAIKRKSANLIVRVDIEEELSETLLKVLHASHSIDFNTPS